MPAQNQQPDTTREIFQILSRSMRNIVEAIKNFRMHFFVQFWKFHFYRSHESMPIIISAKVFRPFIFRSTAMWVKQFIWCGQSRRLGFRPESEQRPLAGKWFSHNLATRRRREQIWSEQKRAQYIYVVPLAGRCSNYRTVNAYGFKMDGIVACEIVMDFCGCARPAHAAPYARCLPSICHA